MSASHIISLVIILASIVITVLNIALICLSKRNSKLKPKVNPEYNAETERNLNHDLQVLSLTVYHAQKLADEISMVAKDYGDWLREVLAAKSLFFADYKRGEELHRKFFTLIEEFNLLIENGVPHD